MIKKNLANIQSPLGCTIESYSVVNQSLADMALEAKELLAIPFMNTLSDKGHSTGSEIPKCSEHGITTFSSTKEHSSQKNGRFIERNFYQNHLEKNKARVDANPESYRQRQQISERQFRTLKRKWHFTHNLVKGKQNVLSEVYLNFSAYYLLRCVRIIGVKTLKNRLKELVFSLSAQMKVFLAATGWNLKKMMKQLKKEVISWLYGVFQFLKTKQYITAC